MDSILKRSRRLVAAVLLGFAGVLAACEATVRVEAPREPITINLNIKADIRVRIEEHAKKDIAENEDIF